MKTGESSVPSEVLEEMDKRIADGEDQLDVIEQELKDLKKNKVDKEKFEELEGKFPFSPCRAAFE